jgi:hypothetical protein
MPSFTNRTYVDEMLNIFVHVEITHMKMEMDGCKWDSKKVLNILFKRITEDLIGVILKSSS